VGGALTEPIRVAPSASVGKPAMGSPHRQQRIDAWLRRPADTNTTVPTPSTPPATGLRVVALYDKHGTSALPWAARGFECEAHDPSIDDRISKSASSLPNVRLCRSALKTADDLRDAVGDTTNVAFVLVHPPCRDLCTAGARWWKRKERHNPQFQLQTKRFLKMVYATLTDLDVPFAILVPSGKRIQRCFPRPPFLFNPCEFGGHLLARAPHPFFSTIPAQDAYTKRTICVTSPGVCIPPRLPVTPIFFRLSQKDGSTRRVSPVLASRKRTDARSCPPLGFCTALCVAAIRERSPEKS